MASGWDRSQGECITGSVSDLDMSSLFSRFYSSCSKMTTSYKYALIKSLLDNLYNVDKNLCLSFEVIFSTFAEVYWNLLLKFRLKQHTGNDNAKINQLLTGFYSKFCYHDQIVPFESLSYEFQLEISSKVMKECSKYVVGAVFTDFSKDGLGFLYSFSKKERIIQFHKDAYKYLCQKKSIIEKVNFFEWARFIEKANRNNSGCIALLDKLDESSKRTNLEEYKAILLEEFGYDECFYCGRRLKQAIHVDHFIPWSFVKDDKLYNFVLSCPKCNLKKSNYLPEQDKVNEVVSRNRVLICNEDRIDLRYRIDTASYTDVTIPHLYEAAQFNGYTIKAQI